MNNLLQVFLLSLTPFGELRLAIPVGLIAYHLDVFLVFLTAVAGNSLVVIFLLLFLKRISTFLSEKSVLFRKSFEWWESNTKDKHYDKVQKYGAIGLGLFVAVPLPLTGAWTGTLLATIMNLPLKKSIPAILLGVVSSAVIVTFAIVLGINIEKYIDWQILVGILASVIFIILLSKFLGYKFVNFKK